jgi:hypothetical protein
MAAHFPGGELVQISEPKDVKQIIERQSWLTKARLKKSIACSGPTKLYFKL